MAHDVDVTLRAMTAADADLVADLHTESWRSAYRGVMADAYLDHDAPADRRAHWNQRLARLDEHQAGFVAEIQAVAVGFAFLFGDHDSHYGTLLDNLHVQPGRRGHGIGRRLLARAAAEMHLRAWEPGLYLWVFEANADARRFYERHGAVAVEVAALTTADGATNPAVRYAWSDADILIQA